MRPTLRRLRLGLGVLTAASALSLLMAPPASADPCYTVWVGTQAVRVCPNGG